MGRPFDLPASLARAAPGSAAQPSPDREQIGKSAAVAAIRSFLNSFLQRELLSEQGLAPGAEASWPHAAPPEKASAS
ncbi:DUF1622 domain-containing protein [Falsiroseomonas bella]|uniref:DUF1622 domain-containing protein n=1 Tax=Falsiroseomonas bella TaxID=2184016 RepID=UPI0011B41D05|nr:DUF1622 domain-containing protein [Falsiroseomonas bella]